MLKPIKRVLRFGVLMLLMLTATLTFSLSGNTQSAGSTLRFLAQKRGIGIGAAVAIEPLRSDSTYQAVLAREFNMVTPENVMKFSLLHPERDQLRWCRRQSL